MGTNPLGLLGGLDDAAAYKVPCKCATTVDMTATMLGLPVIDGYQTLIGDRILVRANTDQTTNGIYEASTGGWCRTTDFTNSSAVYNGTQILIVNGATYAGWVFSCQQDYPTIGATPLTFVNNLVLDTQAAYYLALAIQAADMAAAIAATNWGVWPSRTLFAMSSIATAITSVLLLGYAAPGDGGGPVVYTKLGGAPGTVYAGQVQTADGAWWQIAEAAEYPIEAFGALSTQSNCQPGCQGAIDFLWNVYGGGVLRFGPHRYIINTDTANFAAFQINGVSNVSFLGSGVGATVLAPYGASDFFSMFGTSSAAITGLRIADMTIDASAMTAEWAISASYTFWCPIIENVDIYDSPGGIQFYNTNTPYVNNVLLQGVKAGGIGIYWHASSDGSYQSPALQLNNIVINCTYSGANGILLDGNVGTLNAMNVTVLDSNIGLWVQNTAESINYVPSFIVAFNFVTDGCMTRALQIDGGREFYFTDCWFENTSTPGATGAGQQGFNDVEAVLINGDVGHSYTSDIHFSNCRIGNSKQNGVTINAARNIKFSGCLIEPGGKGSPGSYDGIAIGGAGAQDISVTDCDFSTWGDPLNWRYAVSVAAGTYRIVLNDLNCYGAQAGNILWLNTDASSYCDNATGANGMVSRLAKSDWCLPASIDPPAGTSALTAAQVMGEVLQLNGTPGGCTLNFPSAAQMVQALENPFYLATLELLVVNATNGTVTLVAGAGTVFTGNLSAPGQFTIASAAKGVFKIVFTGPGVGSEAVVVYG